MPYGVFSCISILSIVMIDCSCSNNCTKTTILSGIEQVVLCRATFVDLNIANTRKKKNTISTTVCVTVVLSIFSM